MSDKFPALQSHAKAGRMMVAYDNQNIQTKQGNDEGLTLNKLLIFFAFCRIYKPCFYWSNEALPNPQAKKKKK